MTTFRRVLLRSAVVVVLLSIVGAGYVTRSEAHRLLTNPVATRTLSVKRPTDDPWRLPAEAVEVKSSDGTTLRGWFVPADSPRLLLVQHGYKAPLQTMFGVSALFHRHGYQVMIMCVRGHERSEGEAIRFGQGGEIDDMEAWHAYARTRPGVDSSKVGMYGGSMGGSLAIQYTASHPEIRALVADCSFSSLEDTINTSLRAYTGLPPFPFGPMIRFWAEGEAGFPISSVDAKQWVGHISPRPLLILQGGADRQVSPSSGQRLFDAAKEPKQLWFEPAVGHTQFFKMMPEEFEKRVVGFFDAHLR